LKKITLHSLARWTALLSLLASIFLILIGKITDSGPTLIAFFLLLSIGLRDLETYKGYAFTILIFAAVTTSLYYPQYFTEWSGYKLSGLIIPLLQLIMFGMGSSMSANDFIAVVKEPRGVIIGILSQFTIMPSLGFPPEIAAGIVLVGCSPSGLASNVMAYLAKANLALSLTITSCTTLLAPFVTPLLMKLLAGQYIEINVLNMMLDISKMIILPIIAGLIFNRLLRGNTAWMDKVMPQVSMFGIAFIIVIITAAGRDSLLNIGPILIFIVLLHNGFGYLLGYWSARLLKMKEADARTVAIEVGLQNAGLASGIAKGLGKIATIGLAAGVFGPIMNITGSMLASYWHKSSPDKTEDH
jgi:BASS family bile acid:Na+ symporter